MPLTTRISKSELMGLRARVAELEAWKQNEGARITILGQMLQELADDTNPTGPMADAPVHAEVNRIIHEIFNP